MTAAVRLIPRAFSFVPRAVSAGPVHWRRRLIGAALVALALLAVYGLWFRDSSLARIERVRVVGLSAAPNAARLRGELTAAAARMTTLNVDSDHLHAVVTDDPVVHALELTPEFPHGLTIDVVENRPVALVSAGARSAPVAADGTVLAGVDVAGTLPVVRTVAMPSGRRLDGGAALDRVAVAGAAPPALLPRLASITIQPGRGFVAQLSGGGPAIWLGGSAQLDAKWAAATAVLAQGSSRGATYVDVRLPERPVAGGLRLSASGQVSAEAPAPGALPGSPVPIPADPSAGTAPGQSPAATTPSAPAPATTPTAPANPQVTVQP